MKIKAVAILLVIVLSLFPVYFVDKRLKKILKPGRSGLRLFIYMFLGFVLIFIYTFLLVFVIKRFFRGE